MVAHTVATSTMAESCDFLVVGGGIAGTSAAAELAEHGSVIVVERESHPGYHSTGRSAALFTENYGPDVIRALTVASRPFYEAAPDGFTAEPVFTPRGAMVIARHEQLPALERDFAEARRTAPSLTWLDGGDAVRRAPMLRPDYVAAATWEPDATDLDVHAIHQGYLRRLRQKGGRLVVDAALQALSRKGGRWLARTENGDYETPILVNAAGAWADVVAIMAGARPVALTPKRRTAILFDSNLPDAATADSRWPMVIDAGEEFYFKPDAGKVLASPADETPVEPCDVQPDEEDIAVTVDRVERATRFSIRRITHKWAGLRSFVADKKPVVGFDPEVDGLFWLAGQGGYGIQTAPAMARLAAALVTSGAVPDALAALGVTREALTPARLPRTGVTHTTMTKTD